MMFHELNNDQRREYINSQQRHDAWRKAKADLEPLRGSMVWAGKPGAEYLVRSAYDKKTGLRRQKSLGPRSAETERMKAEFDHARRRLKSRVEDLEGLLERQASVNRALGLGRVPLLGAKIMRGLDMAGLLGRGIRIIGTNALYAYEAAAGVFLEAGITTTEDIDLLFDARQMHFASSYKPSERSLIAILRKVDRSFEKAQEGFRAVNRDGYMVDFIKAVPAPPWKTERETIDGQQGQADLMAAGVKGLGWLEESSPFHSLAVDQRGMPVSIVVADPRVFAAHKFWLSKRRDREPVKRRRDQEQAKAVAQLVTRYLTHLPYEHGQVSVLPRTVFEAARPLFEEDRA